ncbi:rod shape-determining protein MreC [Desulfonatronum thioautotrophicum]|uniref:rod shape-determining protein MreC n=1 Tax=Desulfonatronum thioautotrophicum TaxID=617001 RepID=UPI0013791D8A|nr:rod shape-determining protein MreC [Desulfonatronum thioautotrophicum]
MTIRFPLWSSGQAKHWTAWTSCGRLPSISLLPVRSKRFIAFLFLVIFLLLSIYTWNWRTGFLDRVTGTVGLEIVAWITSPLVWTSNQVRTTWNAYVALGDVHQENERLRAKITDLSLQLSQLHEEASEIARLRALHGFTPPQPWMLEGGRVVAMRFGPHALVESLLVDKGTRAGVGVDTPVITPVGIVGRVMRTSPRLSNVLLVTDPNSRVAIMGRNHRTQGILVGQGPQRNLQMQYVPLNDLLEEGEILVTSGMDGIFPKGLPVARVTRIERPSTSLFQEVEAVPLVDLRNLEEVLLVVNLTPVDAE